MKEKIRCAICRDPIRSERVPPYCSKKCELQANGRAAYSWPKEEREAVAALEAAVKGTTAWRPADLDKVMHIRAPRIGVISDVHCPLHSEKWLLQFMKVCKKYEVRVVIINGDFIDANQISQHAGSYYRRKADLEDDLNAAESVLNLLCNHFDEVYIDAGNHDMRLVKAMGGELSFQRAMKMLYDNKKVQVTSRSFLFVNDSIEVIHPRQYSKIRGKLPQDLAQRWQKSVLVGHEHHSASTISPCGNFQACDIGCLADTEIQDYIRNERTTHVEPLNGFAIIFGNKIQLFDKFTNWELFGLEGM